MPKTDSRLIGQAFMWRRRSAGGSESTPLECYLSVSSREAGRRRRSNSVVPQPVTASSLRTRAPDRPRSLHCIMRAPAWYWFMTALTRVARKLEGQDGREIAARATASLRALARAQPPAGCGFFAAPSLLCSSLAILSAIPLRRSRLWRVLRRGVSSHDRWVRDVALTLHAPAVGFVVVRKPTPPP